MMALDQIDLFGIYVTPAVACFGFALVALAAARRVLDRIEIDRFIYNRALFDLALLAIIFSLMILSLRYGRA